MHAQPITMSFIAVTTTKARQFQKEIRKTLVEACNYNKELLMNYNIYIGPITKEAHKISKKDCFSTLEAHKTGR
jgi:hypothetical protein